tara:strand:- start:282 stop:506 length:225 start_codon:yes stop_codon:yes gene_type:complete
MEVNLTELLNSYEVDPVSFSSPFKSIPTDPSTLVVLRFIPVIGFIALIFAAVWRQGKKFPIRAMGDLKKVNEKD